MYPVAATMPASRAGAEGNEARDPPFGRKFRVHEKI
jgi:hypothetical protein